MFVSTAYAQAAGAAAGPGGLEALFPLVLIFVVFYFLLIRPQTKKAKEHKNMLSAIRRGDKVVTGGGIIGTITKVIDDNEVTVEIADGVKVRVQRALIATVLSKTEPVNDDKKDKKDKKGKEDDKDANSGSEEAKSGVGKLKGLLGGKE